MTALFALATTAARTLGTLGVIHVIAGWRTARDIRKRREAEFVGENVHGDLP